MIFFGQVVIVFLFNALYFIKLDIKKVNQVFSFYF